jgi:hypothetical protein
MDRPLYNELRQMTGNGTQTIIVPSDGTITGIFYRLEFPVESSIRTVTIDGQVDPTPLLSLSVPSGTYMSNVSSIRVTSGIAIVSSISLESVGVLTPPQEMANELESRVVADGGNFESKACLESQLTILNNIV